MSKPKTVDEMAKKLSLEAEGLLAPFGLPSGDKYKDCIENLVDYTIEALTDWLESESKLTCSYNDCDGIIYHFNFDSKKQIGRCSKCLIYSTISIKKYATEEL